MNKLDAERILREEARKALNAELVDAAWRAKVEQFAKLCDAAGSSKTHLAFLCTAMLAKALDPSVNLYAIKPNHSPPGVRSYSARTLCHQVVVPLSAELMFGIGVTGREPLNNQPYFRMERLDDGTPVGHGAKPAFDAMMHMVAELQSATDSTLPREALRAFVAAQRASWRTYAGADVDVGISATTLLHAIETLHSEDLEGGRRAQAIVAAVMDVVYGEDNVESGRVNDPSRRHPGDVCVRSSIDPERWGKAIEVRAKPVSESDVQVFARSCQAWEVDDVVIVAVAPQQAPLNRCELASWAEVHGISLTLFTSWRELVEQALFWCQQAKLDAAYLVACQIHTRLVGVEASHETVARWAELTRQV
jgi:hypothetical protein